jgi:hypothetical protein
LVQEPIGGINEAGSASEDDFEVTRLPLSVSEDALDEEEEEELVVDSFDDEDDFVKQYGLIQQLLHMKQPPKVASFHKSPGIWCHFHIILSPPPTHTQKKKKMSVYDT